MSNSPLSLNATLRLFFDREEIEREIGRAEASRLGEIGKRLRWAARDQLKRRKGPSQAGNAPHVHTTDKRYTLKAIFYFYEPATHSVVVGPAALTSRKPAPQTLEHGGQVKVAEHQTSSGSWIIDAGTPQAWRKSAKRRERTATIAPRPFMAKALAAQLDNLAGEFTAMLPG